MEDLAEPVQPTQPKPKNRFRFLSERYGVHWTIVVGIASLVLGALITIAITPLLEPRKGIAYILTPPTKAYDTSTSSPAFKVVDSASQPITNNIYIVQLTLWNAGDVPIEPADVQDSLKLILYPAQRIFEVKPLFEYRSDIAHYKYTNVDVSQNKVFQERVGTLFGQHIDQPQLLKAVQVDWEHLNKGFGFKWQITYEGAGDLDKGFTSALDGYVVGIDNFARITGPVQTKNALERTIDSTRPPIILMIVTTVGGLLLLRIIATIGKPKPGSFPALISDSRVFSRMAKRLLLFTLVYVTLFFLGLLIYYNFTTPPIPPF